MPPCQGNWMAIGHAVVYYVLAASVFNAGITSICRHCICVYSLGVIFRYNYVVLYRVIYCVLSIPSYCYCVLVFMVDSSILAYP